MRKLIPLFIILSLSVKAFTQNYAMDWRKCFGGTGYDEGMDLLKTSTGYLLLGNWNQQQIWIIKTDLEGNFLWQKKYGGSYSDYGNKIIEAHDHNYFIASTSRSSDGDISYDPYPNSDDFWIIKIDSAGNKLWDKIYGGTGIDGVIDACANSYGGITILGSSTSCDGEVDTCFGFYDFWILTLDSQGNIIWSTIIGGAYHDEPHVIIPTSDEGYLAGGIIYPELSLYGNLSCEGGNDSWDASLFKLDSTGNIEWQHCYGGSQLDGILALYEINNGFLIGASGSSDDGDLTNSGYHLGFYGTGEQTSDTWIINTDLSGNIIWQKCYGGSSTEYSLRIFETKLGYRVFNYSYSFDGDVTGNNSWNSSFSDIWTFEIDSTGNLLSNQCFGDKAYEQMYFGVVKKSDYQYVVAGHTDSPEWQISDDFDVLLFQITDTTVTAVKENELIRVVETYPVPSTDFITFKLKMPGTAKFEVFDCLGIKRYEFEVNENTYTMSVSESPSGLYFYKFVQNGRMYCGKFVVERF